MSRERILLVTAAVLLTIDVAGAYLLDAFSFAERLFAGDAWGVVIALGVAAFLCCRMALYFVLPGYVLAAIGHLVVARARKHTRP